MACIFNAPGGPSYIFFGGGHLNFFSADPAMARPWQNSGKSCHVRKFNLQYTMLSSKFVSDSDSPFFNVSIRLPSQDHLKFGLCGYGLTLYHTIPTLNNPKNRGFFLTIVGKGENASDQHFLLFPPCFLPISTRISVFKLYLFCHLQMFSIWISLNFFRLVKSYTFQQIIYSHKTDLENENH